MQDSTGQAKAFVRAENVRKEFFRKGRESASYFDAVRSCSLGLEAGELVALMGRSGSGKSTLLSMLSGLLEPTEGAVFIGETNLYALADSELSRFRNEHFGIVPQGHTPLHSLTVEQNVALPLDLYRGHEGKSGRAMELLEEVGIAQLADSYPNELSGGELRRMAIARALVCNPECVFADEPTGDLDDENTENVFKLLRGVADDGAAVLVVTHESCAETYADRVLRMDAGTLQC